MTSNRSSSWPMRNTSPDSSRLFLQDLDEHPVQAAQVAHHQPLVREGELGVPGRQVGIGVEQRALAAADQVLAVLHAGGRRPRCRRGGSASGARAGPPACPGCWRPCAWCGRWPGARRPPRRRPSCAGRTSRRRHRWRPPACRSWGRGSCPDRPRSRSGPGRPWTDPAPVPGSRPSRCPGRRPSPTARWAGWRRGPTARERATRTARVTATARTSRHPPHRPEAKPGRATGRPGRWPRPRPARRRRDRWGDEPPPVLRSTGTGAVASSTVGATPLARTGSAGAAGASSLAPHPRQNL